MPIRFFCPECNKPLSIGTRKAGTSVVCPGCEAGSFALDEEAHSFLVHALGRQLADFPTASDRAARGERQGRRRREGDLCERRATASSSKWAFLHDRSIRDPR